MKTFRTVVFLLALALVAAACGDDSSGVDTSSDDTQDGPDATDGDAGAGTADGSVVVQVLVAGGFVPAEVALRTVPQLTVTSDGTVITGAPVLLIYPGPAIAPLQAGTADPAAVDALLAQAGELGLLDGPLDFGQPPVTDTPDTTVTIVVDGTTHTHVANALDMTFEGGDFDGSAFSAEVQANREALAEFVRAAQALGLGDREWVPSAIGVTVVGPYQPLDEPADPESFEWPLATAPETQGNFPCTVVEGDDAGVLLELLSAANERTPWLVEGELLTLAFRPVVPGQPGCP